MNQARKAEEQRAQRMAAEMSQYRHDMERRLTDKEEELESIKYFDNSSSVTCQLKLITGISFGNFKEANVH